MAIFLLDRSLKVEIYFDESDSQFEDNVCLCITEDCPEEEKLFKADEVNIYLTPEQACQLATALSKAAVKSGQFSAGSCQ